MTITAEAKVVESSSSSNHVKLTGQMGAFSLALTVLAFSAPLTTVSGYIPVALSFGGIASPLAFMFVTAMILIFGIGYVTLNAAVKRPGDFYAFISYGLGKEAGLGSGLMAAVSYFLILTGVAAYFGVSCADLHQEISGFSLPWYWYALGCWLAVGVLGYLNVELSAKVLTWVMVAEVVVCLIFAVGVLKNGGDSTIATAAPFSVGELEKPGVNLPFAMLFVVSFFMGFEATALFRDEVRLPDKTIPIATYGAIIFIGAIYTFSAYAMIMAYGSNVQEVAAQSPANMFTMAFSKFVDGRFHVLTSALILTSAFACILSIHNVLSRYLYNLGTDGALPGFLKRVHPKHASPYKASVTVSLLVLAVLCPFIVLQVKPELLYGQLSGVGTAGVIFLLTLVNFSALTWFFRKGRHEKASILKSFMAPAISSVFFVSLVVLVAKNFELLAGGEPGERVWMLYSLFFVQVIGMLLACYYKKAKPETFEKLGRAHN
ncbi:APC family permease [Pseudomonas sp. DR48]|uniref:APC family permease n=1 Tax=Pseudomonas sp. DR48 TaxID=2871095 RepID=UPI001C9A1FD2|nr:APC family permease [Pseudomonas sp. DR48]QZP31650.1 APC family permease [Pseudomonas sp. DR48]